MRVSERSGRELKMSLYIAATFAIIVISVPSLTPLSSIAAKIRCDPHISKELSISNWDFWYPKNFTNKYAQVSLNYPQGFCVFIIGLNLWQVEPLFFFQHIHHGQFHLYSEFSMLTRKILYFHGYKPLFPFLRQRCSPHTQSPKNVCQI